MNEKNVFELLEQSNWRVIKELRVVSKNKLRLEIGSIFYQRVITNEYNIAESTETDPIKKLLDSPKQSSFPIDEIDNIILDAVKEKYPETYVRSFLAATNRDFERLENQINCLCAKTVLQLWS